MSPVALPQNARAALMNQADRVRQRLQGSSFQDFARFAELSGGRAIVAPSKSIVIRILPRWDVALQYVQSGNQVVRNPKYPEENRVMVYVGATAHWIVNPINNKPQRLWCRLMLNEDNERCPICEAYTALINGSEEDKKLAKDIRAKESYMFNAIIRGPHGETAYTEKGEPDIRILNVPPTVWVSIIDIMTGGPEAQESFAKGEIFDPKDGYDLMITRPASGGNDRYKVACANTTTPLYTAAEAAKWKGWTKKLHNLENEIGPEAISSFNDVWKAFYGRDPEEGETTDQSAGALTTGAETAFDTPPQTEEVAGGVDPSEFGEAGADTASDFEGIGLPGADPDPVVTPPARTTKAATTPPPPSRPAATRPPVARGRR